MSDDDVFLSAFAHLKTAETIKLHIPEFEPLNLPSPAAHGAAMLLGATLPVVGMVAMMDPKIKAGIKKELHDPRLYSNLRGVFESQQERIDAHKHLDRRKDHTIGSAMREGFTRGGHKKEAADEDLEETFKKFHEHFPKHTDQPKKYVPAGPAKTFHETSGPLAGRSITVQPVRRNAEGFAHRAGKAALIGAAPVVAGAAAIKGIQHLRSKIREHHREKSKTASDDRDNFNRAAKVTLQGLAGFGIGLGGGAAAAHIANKVYNHVHGVEIPVSTLAKVAPLLSAGAGLTYALHQANQAKEMKRDRKDSKR